MTAHGPRRETAARAAEAARLRAVGRTWAEIADVLGYRSRSGALEAVQRHYAREAHDPAASRRSAVDGLRIVMQVLFENLAAAKARGDAVTAMGLSREIRSTTDQLAKLDGLHAAQRTQLDVKVEHTVDPFDEMERLVLAQLQERLAVEAGRRRPEVIDAEVVAIESGRR